MLGPDGKTIYEATPRTGRLDTAAEVRGTRLTVRRRRESSGALRALGAECTECLACACPYSHANGFAPSASSLCSGGTSMFTLLAVVVAACAPVVP